MRGAKQGDPSNGYDAGLYPVQRMAHLAKYHGSSARLRQRNASAHYDSKLQSKIKKEMELLNLKSVNELPDSINTTRFNEGWHQQVTSVAANAAKRNGSLGGTIGHIYPRNLSKASLVQQSNSSLFLPMIATTEKVSPNQSSAVMLNRVSVKNQSIKDPVISDFNLVNQDARGNLESRIEIVIPKNSSLSMFGGAESSYH